MHGPINIRLKIYSCTPHVK